MAQLPLLWLLVLLPFAAPSDPQEGLVVRVAQGRLQGKRIDRPYAPFSTFYAFEGIPYARPPVGERRFKDPQEPESWTGTRNATSFGPNCIQKTSIGDDTGEVFGEEDCLYLNIYTADPPNLWKIVKRPVTVFIHGGGFLMWSGNTDSGRPDPFIRQEMVFITFNYRLGVMGFLNTEDAEAPGNAGLKDQNLALRWVQKNIAVFGGNPRNVALMGESAGGSSAHYHMLSPLSKGLFHRAISISGSTLPLKAFVEKPRETAGGLRRRYASFCADLPEEAIAPCLRRVNASDLVFNQYDVGLAPFQNYFVKMTFLPSVEVPGTSSTPFLTAAPEQLLEEGRFTRVPLMTGFTSGEGIVFLWFANLLQDSSRWQEVDENFNSIFPWDFPNGLRTPEVAKLVREFYLGNSSLRNGNENLDILQKFELMLTDIYMTTGISRTVELMAKNGGTVYVYQFSRDGPFSLRKAGMNASHIAGVTHGEDMEFLFDFFNATANAPVTVPPSEIPVRERQQKIFGNFAKFGNPTPEGSGLLKWPLYTLRKESYLDMDLELSAPDKLLGKRNDFWRRLRKSMQPDSTTPNSRGVKA